MMATSNRTALLVFASALGLALSSGAAAQADVRRDEQFDLNIVNEHVTEHNFYRSAAASVRIDHLILEAGAAVSAERIDMTIRGVRGRVTFRSDLRSLDRIFRRTAP